MKTVFSYLCVFFLAIGVTQGQELPEVNTLVPVPNSPEAEAFARYGEVPISYYTGKPNVAVPIYTIQGKELSVPISLSYDASGIKIQSIASSVGTLTPVVW